MATSTVCFLLPGPLAAANRRLTYSGTAAALQASRLERRSYEIRKMVQLRAEGDYCSWCDGTGVIIKGLHPTIKANASCVACSGTGWPEQTALLRGHSDAGHKTLLTGPYDTEEEAIAVKAQAWKMAEEVDAWAHFHTVSLAKR